MTTTTPQTAADPDTDAAQDEAITGLLAAIVAEAGVLLRSQLSGMPADGHGLRRLAGYVAALTATETAAPPGAWTLETAPQGGWARADRHGWTWLHVPEGADDPNPWLRVLGSHTAERWDSTDELLRRGAVPVSPPSEVVAVPEPVATVKTAPEPAAETLADDSLAGRTASYARRATILHGRLVAALGEDVYSVVSASPSGGAVQVSSTVALATARMSVALLPGGQVKARRGSDDNLWIETTGVGIDQGIEIVAPVPVADQAAARTWLAELGVQVDEPKPAVTA